MGPSPAVGALKVIPTRSSSFSRLTELLGLSYTNLQLMGQGQRSIASSTIFEDLRGKVY